MNIFDYWEKEKNYFLKKENFFFLFIILLIFLIDRVIKLKIIKDFSENTFYVNNFINIDLIWNIGIGFGFLSTSSTLFYNLISSIIGSVIIMLIFVILKSNKFDKFIFSLIVGGALGNFYDRLIFKAVPDFIDLHYNNFHWFTFNVADMFISLGIIIFICKSFFIKN